MRPLAVFFSFSSFSGLALLRTNCISVLHSLIERSQLTLKKIRSPPSHSRMDIGLIYVNALENEAIHVLSGPNLRCFDVIVEIVAEGLNVRNSLLPPLQGQMARKQNYSWSVTISNEIFKGRAHQTLHSQLHHYYHQLGLAHPGALAEAHCEKGLAEHSV